MNIILKEQLNRISQDKFHAIDKIVMKHAYNIHNEMGRFYDEKIYHKELCHNLNKIGLNASNEVEIKISHKEFLKNYFMDLVVNNSVIYELKAIDQFSGINKKQLINYLLLSNISHGKLINFATTSVEYEFISTQLNHKKRLSIEINSKDYISIDNDSIVLFQIVSELIKDWGAFLDLELYKEAIVFLLGGKELIIRKIDIIKNTRIIGQQNAYILNDKTMFHISALSEYFESYETHVKRILKHTNFKAIQWINFNKNKIIFKTIK